MHNLKTATFGNEINNSKINSVLNLLMNGMTLRAELPNPNNPLPPVKGLGDIIKLLIQRGLPIKTNKHTRHGVWDGNDAQLLHIFGYCIEPEDRATAKFWIEMGLEFNILEEAKL